MRIAFVHSFYTETVPSGENQVVLDQMDALRQRGHEVTLVDRHTDEQAAKTLYPLRAAVTVATGTGFDPTRQLAEFAPDVVHVTNLFPNIGTTWVERWPGPLIVSEHNYRSICSNGLLYRGTAVCTECVFRGSFHALIHRCYRDSVFATLPLAVSRSREQRAVLGRADAVITTSEWSDRVLRESVRVPIRTRLIPNFGPDNGRDPLPASRRSGWVALGRFSEEKGLLELVDSWPDRDHLTVIGEGPLRESIERAAQGKSVSVRQAMPREELRRILPNYIGLIFPSRWLEVAPQVVVEAARVGLPVIAFEANGVAELVMQQGMGVAYRSESELEIACDRVARACDDFSYQSARYYRENWRPEVWLTSIEDLYSDVVRRYEGRPQ